MSGITELQAIKNWIAANRTWLFIAILSSLALIVASFYYVIADRQPAVTGFTPKQAPSNIYPIKPITQTSLNITSLATDNQPPLTTVKVNKQPVDMPASGVIHQVFDDASGTTTIEVSSDSKSSGEGSSNSFMNIELNSVSQSSDKAESGQ